jgi:hypothetical protein
MLTTAISLAIGFVSKKIIVRNEDGPLKKILGTVLQIGITNLVSKNTDQIKSIASFLIMSSKSLKFLIGLLLNFG